MCYWFDSIFRPAGEWNLTLVSRQTVKKHQGNFWEYRTFPRQIFSAVILQWKVCIALTDSGIVDCFFLLLFFNTFNKCIWKHRPICFSTGYYSWRNPETGSVFIGELCEMLKDCQLEIIQILTRVNHRVAFHFQSHTTDLDTHMKRQMPCFASKLTKDFYLHVAEKKNKLFK